jgi:hypothetical protein
MEKVMTTRLFACLLAGALMVPQVAQASDSVVRRATLPAATESLPLPRVPHFETIPWLARAAEPGGKNDSALLDARLDPAHPALSYSTARLDPFAPTRRVDGWQVATQ